MTDPADNPRVDPDYRPGEEEGATAGDPIVIDTGTGDDGVDRDYQPGAPDGYVKPPQERPVPGETTKGGFQKEIFGAGSEAQSAAGTKGGGISAARPPEARQEASRKAARTRAERYGHHLYKSDPDKDDLMGVDTGAHLVDNDPAHT